MGLERSQQAEQEGSQNRHHHKPNQLHYTPQWAPRLLGLSPTCGKLEPGRRAASPVSDPGGMHLILPTVSLAGKLYGRPLHYTLQINPVLHGGASNMKLAQGRGQDEPQVGCQGCVSTSSTPPISLLPPPLPSGLFGNKFLIYMNCISADDSLAIALLSNRLPTNLMSLLPEPQNPSSPR